MALLVASLVAIPHHHHLLGGLEALSLRLAAAAFGVEGESGLARELDKGDGAVPRVVVLTEYLYETEFRQRSPLDRVRLVGLLDRLFPPVAGEGCGRRNLPGVLVVDLDLSPDPPPPADAGAADADSPGDRALEALLTCLPGQTQLVLARSIPLLAPGARAVKGAWQERLCKAGVRFAQPYIASTFGTVLRMDPDAETLARMAHDIHTARRAGEALPPLPACDREAAGTGLAPVDAPRGEEAKEERDREAESILNFRFARALDPVRIDTPEDADQAVFTEADVVFLGGEFGTGDRYLTPAGTLDGVYLHAGAFYTLQHPVKPWAHGKGFLLDLLIGVGVGWLFTRTHERYVLREARSGAPLSGWKAEGAGLRALATLALDLAVPVVVAGFLMVVAGWLLLRNLWIHPFAMVTGMFLHSTLIRTRRPSLAHGTPGPWWDVRPWGSWALLAACAGIVAWAVIELFAH